MSSRLLNRVLGTDTEPSTRTTESNAVTARYDPRLDAVVDRTGTPALAEASHPHLAAPWESDRETARDTARAYRREGASAEAFVASHGVATDAAVEAAFEELRAAGVDEALLERVEADLTGALDDVLASAATGVTAFGRQVAADGGAAAEDTSVPVATPADTDGTDTSAEPSAFDATDVPLDTEALLDRMGAAIFVIDADGDLAVWNEELEALTGVSREEAAEKEMISEAFYHDGRRAQTLADKVLDAPESADEEYGVPRVDDAGFTLYRDRSTMTAAGGEDVHISFSAAPLYDDGELVGVVEMVQDRTEDTVRQERTGDLVSEIQATVEAVQAGEFDERASFADEGYVDDELLSVVDSINDLADRFEVLETRVKREVSDLHDEAETVADSSMDINAAADDQRETMHQLSSEIATLSATVEEVAASATQVDATSSDAERLAEEGQDAAEEAVALLDDVDASADEVAEDVDALSGRVDEIDDIATVINDIADQTNILALNASIEAARAGEAGEGFAVVADEVKNLAEESQQHASDIEALVEGIQADTDETVASLATTTERIDEVIDQVEAAMNRLVEIVDAVSETSAGIQEVADATDEQAASTEEVASMIDEAADAADDIADDIQQIAAANEEQMERADRITAHFQSDA
jgi:methyl-accepting chemotaxis protein